ncbi:MAG: hypothetical protein ABW321_08850 [Polyangiales bacterium]
MNLTNVRRFAVAAVAANVAVIGGAALALPRELLVLLPIAGLVLPLLTTSVVEAAAERVQARHAV